MKKKKLTLNLLLFGGYCDNMRTQQERNKRKTQRNNRGRKRNMNIYSKKVTLEDIKREEQRKHRLEFWLVKFPLILWVVVALAVFGMSESHTVAWLLLLLGYLGILPLACAGICKLFLWLYYKNG